LHRTTRAVLHLGWLLPAALAAVIACGAGGGSAQTDDLVVWTSAAGLTKIRK
jgi:hypothetical protein